jgi:hypothetical protein
MPRSDGEQGHVVEAICGLIEIDEHYLNAEAHLLMDEANELRVWRTRHLTPLMHASDGEAGLLYAIAERRIHRRHHVGVTDQEQEETS